MLLIVKLIEKNQNNLPFRKNEAILYGTHRVV